VFTTQNMNVRAHEHHLMNRCKRIIIKKKNQDLKSNFLSLFTKL